MSINDQARTLGTALSTLPSETLVKVCMVFCRLGLRHWEEETKKHQAAMTSYPEGSRMRAAADSAYGNAFRNWHRLSMLSGALNAVLKHPTYGTPPVVEQKAAA